MTNSKNDIENLSDELHSRVLSGDPTASAQIAEQFLPLITDKLIIKYPGMDDPHLINTAVVDAFYTYLNDPQKFDSEKTSLLRYLLMSARGDLLNLLAREKGKNIIPLAEHVELSDSQQEYRMEVATLVSEDNVEQIIITKTSPIWNLVKEYLPNPTDQEFLNLLMDNIRDTSEYAKLLGLQDLPPEEQRKIVKRHKDRIKKIITRKIPRDNLE